MKAYITKYALTSGIYVVDGAIAGHNQGMFCVDRSATTLAQYFHGNDWHTTWESAEAQAYSMAERKLKSLRKQLKKLEDMEFKNPETP